MARNSTSFRPGQSGNPKGRKPKTLEQIALETACREHTINALDVILDIMFEGENERNRLSAAQYILERGWGKAKQAAEVSLQNGEQLSIEVHYVDAIK